MSKLTLTQQLAEAKRDNEVLRQANTSLRIQLELERQKIQDLTKVEAWFEKMLDAHHRGMAEAIFPRRQG